MNILWKVSTRKPTPKEWGGAAERSPDVIERGVRACQRLAHQESRANRRSEASRVRPAARARRSNEKYDKTGEGRVQLAANRWEIIQLAASKWELCQLTASRWGLCQLAASAWGPCPDGSSKPVRAVSRMAVASRWRPCPDGSSKPVRAVSRWQ